MHAFWSFTLNSSCNCHACSAVVQLHDEQSEGLSRRLIIKMVRTAGGGKLTLKQAENLWDNTIFPLGKKRGLLTGYVKAQDGTSKRTAAGKVELQRQWYDCVTKLIKDVRDRAFEVLGDETLVDKMLVWLIVNLDEECLNAMGKNYRVVGSKRNKKHNNQHGSSRHVLATSMRFFFF